MTTKPLFLNQILTSIQFLSLLPTSKCFFLALITSTLLQVTSAIAETLPSPPSVRSPQISEQEQTNSTPATSNLNKREYTFSAPTSEPVTEERTHYRVEVFGNSDLLLNQVRTIEPKAFRQGDSIQVGIFSDRENAEDLVRKLALQGLWARIQVR